MFPIFSENGEAVAFGGRILPGSDDPAKYKNSRGDADLRQVEDAVRAELGEGRHRHGRPGDRVRGLHRRDRVPPGGRAAGGGHVRHGVHRGARAPAQALRQPGRAGVRRRRRRAGRRRAVLRVGAEVPGGGRRSPRCRDGQGPGRAGPDRSGGAGRGGRRAVPFLGFRLQRVLHGRAADTPEERARLAEEAMAVVNEHPEPERPQAVRRPGGGRVGLPVADLVAVGRARVEAPVDPGADAAGSVRPMENAEFVAIALLVQRLERRSRRGWSRRCSPTMSNRRAFLARRRVGGRLRRRARARRSRGARVARAGRRRRHRRRSGGRGAQPDRRGRAP